MKEPWRVEFYHGNVMGWLLSARYATREEAEARVRQLSEGRNNLSQWRVVREDDRG